MRSAQRLFPALASGARLLLRDRFSATSWLNDVRAHDVTFTNTVGRALGYVLATPTEPGDRDHRLKVVFAPEASPRDMAAFTARFGADGARRLRLQRGRHLAVPCAQAGFPRQAPPGADIAVVDSSGAECERGRVRCRRPAAQSRREHRGTGAPQHPRIGSRATGTIPKRTSERLRGGWFWSGDLAYRDDDDVFWFAGRVGDWLRVDSENFAASPVERIVGRYGPAAAVAVVGVPDPVAGDQVMAVLELSPGRVFDPLDFTEFLNAQSDLGTKWAPRFVRVTTAIPVLGNGKIDKKPLRRDAWLGEDPVWWQPPRASAYTPMTSTDRDWLREQFEVHDRMGAFPSPAPSPPAQR